MHLDAADLKEFYARPLGRVVRRLLGVWPLDRIPAYLLMPYLAWVCYATALNAAIWRLN